MRLQADAKAYLLLVNAAWLGWKNPLSVLNASFVSVCLVVDGSKSVYK